MTLTRMYRRNGINYTYRTPDSCRVFMYEFLTGLSSGQPVLWALFVLGVISSLALLLGQFWNGVALLVRAVSRKAHRR